MRAFVPAKIKDNPSVNRDEYVRNLKHLGPVVRERLMNGDWTIMPTGAIKPEWLRYFSMRGQIIQLLISRMSGDGDILHTNEIMLEYGERECRRFVTVDTAGGTKDLTQASKGKGYSWTVAAVWDHKSLDSGIGSDGSLGRSSNALPNAQALLLRYVWRARAGFVEVAENLLRINKEYAPHSFRVEDKTMGPDLVDLLRGKLNISVIGTGSVDKMVRNAPFQNMMARGEVYLPKIENSGWRQAYESEILSWRGIEGETNDQVDVSSYAAIECGSYSSNTMMLEYDPREAIQATKHESATGGWLGTSRGGIKW